MRFSEVGAAIDGLGSGYQPAPRRHFHGGPDRRSRKQVIEELGLREGVRIRLQSGEERVVRKIINDEVFVQGVKHHVNVYGAVVIP